MNIWGFENWAFLFLSSHPFFIFNTAPRRSALLAPPPPPQRTVLRRAAMPLTRRDTAHPLPHAAPHTAASSSLTHCRPTVGRSFFYFVF
jgi:hypothetical protein